MFSFYLPSPMQNFSSKFKDGMRQTEIASNLSTTIFLATGSQKGLTTFSHIKTVMSKTNIDWKEIQDACPLTYDNFLTAKVDVWDFLDSHGIWAYIFDPTVNENKGWFWEIKYMNKEITSVSLSDCVLTTQSKCISRMIWRAFKLIEDGEVMSVKQYEKDFVDNTPSDWKQAKKKVDGLMNLYTSTAIKRAKRKKNIKAYPSLVNRGRGGDKQL